MFRVSMLLAMLLCEQIAQSADKYALLIGVTKYQKAQMNRTPLQFPEVDAKSVGELLQKSGYTVKLLLGSQATEAAIERELAEFEQQGSHDGVVFIGLFGHGVQYGQDAYFCPYDTRMRKLKDSKGNTVYTNSQPTLEPDPASMTSMKRLLEALNTAGAGNRVMMADCCREDPSAARGALTGRAFGSNVKLTDLGQGTAAIFSCSNSEQAFEHRDWGHGAFTKAFLDYCNRLGANGDASVNSMSAPLYRRVSSLVKAKSPNTSQRINPITNGIVDLQLESGPPAILTNRTGMQLKLIPEGSFLMGSSQSARELAVKYKEYGANESYLTDEHPRHRVTLTKPFYMGIHEVTRGQFAVFVRDQNYQTEPERDGEGGFGWNEADRKFEGPDPKYSWHSWRNAGVAQTDDHPVVNVTWNDAVAFCQWLSRKEGRTYRLPTEAEWEYACRAETTGDFHNGDAPESLVKVGNIADATARAKYANWTTAVYAADGHVFTAPVGCFQANAFGLYDMHGNVWEWCSDGPRKYSSRSVTNPIGPTGSGSSRVLRGGSWYYHAYGARSAYRSYYTPGNRNHDRGFRVVCE
ncbi:MAG: SUMF1/EgtB/PvdO family nonheme iron enzyme [Planctomycetaceae bacterium]|nr:SUMF1/EgtB/PvdO family nonheme iron enzyme [Planctomycetaceae bacterium]